MHHMYCNSLIYLQQKLPPTLNSKGSNSRMASRFSRSVKLDSLRRRLSSWDVKAWERGIEQWRKLWLFRLYRVCYPSLLQSWTWKWVHPILVSFHLASFSTSIILGGQVICKGITHLVRFHIDTCVTRGCKLESTKWSLDEFSSWNKDAECIDIFAYSLYILLGPCV